MGLALDSLYGNKILSTNICYGVKTFPKNPLEG